VLREAATLVLEGHPRAAGGAVAAPLPGHAAPVLDRLFTRDITLAEFQKELAETHAHQPEVTPAARAAHVGLEAVLLAPALFVLFALALTLSAWLALGTGIEADAAAHAAAALADGTERAGIAGSGNPALDADLVAALANPRVRVRADELAARLRAEADARRAALLPPQRRLVEQVEASAEGAESRTFSGPAVRAVVLWAGERDRSRGRDGSPFTAQGPTVTSAFAVIAGGTVLLAAVFRGGLSLVLVGIGLVRADGRRAARWQCALRAALVWAPVMGLLFVSAALQIHTPQRPYLAAGFYLAAVALLPVYAVLALRFPTQPPQDRLLGTFLVPR
jgi:hypothetical protein